MKKCLRKCTEYTNTDNPTRAHSVIRTLALHSQYHPVLGSPFTHLVLSIDSVSVQLRSYSDCRCTNYHPDLGSPLSHLVVSIDSVSSQWTGWLGVAKVLCILRHRDVQLILAYSWTGPAILVAAKGRGEMFVSSVYFHSRSFSPVPLSSLLSLLSLFSLSLGDDTKWPSRVDLMFNPNTISEDPVRLHRCTNYHPGLGFLFTHLVVSIDC